MKAGTDLNKRVNFRVTDEDYHMIKLLSALEGKSMTGFIMHLVNQKKEEKLGVSNISEMIEKLGVAA